MPNDKRKTWYAYCVSGPEADDLGAYLDEAERDRALAADMSGCEVSPPPLAQPTTVTVGTVVAATLEEALDAIRLDNWETKTGA
jgi:hypothetical protein